jgi:protein TonB
MATLQLPWAAFSEPTTWYRLPSVKVAFVVSLLIHAAAIALLPNLRVPEPPVPSPLTVELLPQLPPPLPTQVPPRPAPVVAAAPKPVPPPPVPEVKPEPQPEPPPVVESRPLPPPQPIPPQPIVVPQVPAAPEPPITAPPRAEMPPQAHVEPPPAPRVQTPSAPTLDATVLREYGAVVSSVVAKKKVYPRLALMRRWQGTTDLKLQIAADGNVKALSVAHSSGFDILDEQALKMVKDAMPLPGLPDALRGREFAIDIPVAFRLHE